MKVELNCEGGKISNEGWNPEKVKTIIIKFEGKLTSRYSYPINPNDLIRKIVIRVEEK